MLENDFAVTFIMLIKYDAGKRVANEPRQLVLAVLESAPGAKVGGPRIGGDAPMTVPGRSCLAFFGLATPDWCGRLT